MAELIIVFREVLEATLIVGILYTFLKQTNQDESLTKLWQGVLVALAASIVGSFLFQTAHFSWSRGACGCCVSLCNFQTC